YPFFIYFFFNAPSPPYIYTLSLHDALPISRRLEDLVDHLVDLLNDCDLPPRVAVVAGDIRTLHIAEDEAVVPVRLDHRAANRDRSEEHTSELQSRGHLVCRLLLEKKKQMEI